jgi:glycosyltransferase involved in cell wall biosynthesis
MYKIMMIAPTPFFAHRGCSVRVYEEARALGKLGNEVVICTYHHGDDVPGLAVHRIANVPWYQKLGAGPSYHKLYLDVLLWFKSLQVARQIKPHVIHGHLHEGTLLGNMVGRILNLPLLSDVQGSLTGELKAHGFVRREGLYSKLLLRLERAIDAMPDVSVASSSAVADELRDRFGARRVFLARDGVDKDVFRPAVPRASLREPLPDDAKIVVYLGLLSDYQGIDCLLEAVPLVVRGNDKVHFLLMGYPNVDKYRVKAHRLSIDGHVTFTGRIPYSEAPSYLTLGDLAVAPKMAETESHGKLYNYMACGLPIVAFDTPVNREILSDLGLYARLGDASSLASALLGAIGDEGLLADLGRKLRERAVTLFSWENTARQLMECYSLALGQRGW